MVGCSCCHVSVCMQHVSIQKATTSVQIQMSPLLLSPQQNMQQQKHANARKASTEKKKKQRQQWHRRIGEHKLCKTDSNTIYTISNQLANQKWTRLTRRTPNKPARNAGRKPQLQKQTNTCWGNCRKHIRRNSPLRSNGSREVVGDL